MFLKGTDFENGQNQASKSNEIWGLSSAHFIFGKPTRKQQTMVKLQLAANAIAKSRLQIKPQPVKGSSINTILIFSMADAPGCSSHIAGSERSQSIIKNPRLNE